MCSHEAARKGGFLFVRMKQLIHTLIATLTCAAAFAQGRISFSNDSLHLVYYDDPSNITQLNGQAVYAGNTPFGIIFVADLYMGTDSGSLSLLTTATFCAVPGAGKWAPTSVITPYPEGLTVFIEVQVRDAAFPPPTTFTGVPFGDLYGVSQEFSFTLGSNFTYPPMWGTDGNWAAGTQNMDAYGVGSRGAIAVQTFPEPILTIVPGPPGQVTISWTPATPGFVLQQSSDLAAAIWTNSPGGSTNPISVPAIAPATFYRLTKP